MKLKELNNLKKEEFIKEISKCCGSTRWIEQIYSNKPFSSFDVLLKKAEEIWNGLSEEDWREAFSYHPKIGDVNSLRKKFEITEYWASKEQSGIHLADELILKRFATKNKEYEEKIGYIFIICATGKRAEEMLNVLTDRLNNTPENEIRIAAGEQAKITKLRLEKLLF